MSTARHDRSRAPGVSGAVGGAPDAAEMRRFTGAWALSPDDPIPGPGRAVKEKRELSPGPPPACPGLSELPPAPCPSKGILTLSPFDGRRRECGLDTGLPHLLGPAHPCPIAVHMEPFSTSVFKVLI